MLLGLGTSIARGVAPAVEFLDEYSLEFDGVTGGNANIIDLGRSTDFDSAKFSIFFWVKMAASTTGTLLGIGGTTYNLSSYKGFRVRKTAANRFSCVIAKDASSESEVLTAVNPVVEGTWYHIGFTYDGTDLKSYENGVLSNTTTTTYVPGGSSESLKIGPHYYNPDSRDSFKGKLSEFAYYDEDLTAGEITTIYNEGDPYNHSLGANAADLKSWLRMGDGDYDTVGSIAGDNDTPQPEGGIVSDASNPILGSENMINPSFEAAGTGNWLELNASHNTVANVSDQLVITNISAGNNTASLGYLRGANVIVSDVGPGVYRFEFNCKVSSGTVNLSLYGSTESANPSIPITNTGFETHVFHLLMYGSSANTYIYIYVGDGVTFTVDSMSMKKVGTNSGKLNKIVAADWTSDTP